MKYIEKKICFFSLSKYSNDLEHLHAKLFAIALPAVYVLFAILISLKWCKIETQPSNQQMKMRKSVGKIAVFSKKNRLIFRFSSKFSRLP